MHENEWSVDGASECLLPPNQAGPFRTSVRWSAAVDRLNGNAERHAAACIEYRRDAGLWAAISFADDDAHARWSEPVRGAWRWLADTGFGGERSRGWGSSAQPEFAEGTLPELILGTPAALSFEAAVVPAEADAGQHGEPETETASVAAEPAPVDHAAPTSHWLLSLFTPGAGDGIDWKRGNYTVTSRGGRIDSAAGSGQAKKGRADGDRRFRAGGGR